MATVPPVPPRPIDSYDQPRDASAPPVPPLPPNFRPDYESSPPHFEDPLVAPRPQKLQPDLPANMVRSLDEQLSAAPNSYPLPPTSDYYNPSQPNIMPGFAFPTPNNAPPPTSHTPLPPPQGADWSPWNAGPPQPSYSPYPPQQSPYPPPPPSIPAPGPYPPQPYGQPRPDDHLANSFHRMSLGPQQSSPPPLSAYSPYPPPSASPPRHGGTAPLQPKHHARVPSAGAPYHASPSTSPLPSPPAPGNGGAPSLTAPLPTISSLIAGMTNVKEPNVEPARKIAWAKDVLSLVDRAHQVQTASANAPNVNSTDVPVGPVRIGDTQLQRLVDMAIPMIQQISSPQPMPSPMPPHVVEAIYWRAVCEASGAYPQFIPHNPRTAFRDFETAAKNGFYAAWFKLGRDYENFGDLGHAKDCFERGVKYGVESCLYRMGMAHLMGQLGVSPSPEKALPLLQRAATLATVEVPQPAYVYGLLLLSEFSHVSIPPHLFQPLVPAGSTPHAEARKHLERAAYLNFAPAQYKLGHSYEYATPPFPFDALLSVQYYSLASQQGEVEADMALSKWFLCGAEGAFEKDEGLAFTFAEKAAKKGLPSAEFAMGYYAEVGVGGPKDLQVATHWYTLASEHGNTDATDRLKALSQPAPQSLSRQEHENLTDTTLVRKRTQAKQRSDARGPNSTAPGPVGHGDRRKIMENVRKNSMVPPIAVAAPAPGGYPQQTRLPAVNEAPSSYPSPHAASASPRPRPPQQQPQPQGTPGPQAQGQAQGRPFQNATRYSLADPGASPSASPRPGAQGAPAHRQPSGQYPQGGTSVSGGTGVSGGGGFESAPAPKPAKGPQTFAEMGIASKTAQKEDCVIM